MENGTGLDSLTVQFEQIAEHYTAQLRENRNPNIDDYVNDHPDLESVIRRLFPVLELMESDGSLPGNLSDLCSGDRLEASEAARSLIDSPIGLQLGEFQILREIGRGGMGIVYLARQNSLGRNVALKLVSRSAQFDHRRRTRFQQEARASAMLHHTNIVPIFDIGRYEDLSYLVMQYIESQSLDDILLEAPAASVVKRDVSHVSTTKLMAKSTDPSMVLPVADSELNGKGLDLPSKSMTSPANRFHFEAVGESRQRCRWAAELGVQIAEALAHAHSKGILHRDIKPSNLLINSNGEAWVTDFGLAKTIDSPEITESGEIVGTLRYMSPEQMNGLPDHRSDIYALGLTLYEVATLRPAFDSPSRELLIKQVVESEPDRVQAVDPLVPRDLATIIEKAIAREPKRRYQTAQAFSDDLRRFLEGEPIVARRVNWIERTYKWCVRRPLPAALIAGLFLSLVAGIAGVTYHSRNTSKALGELEIQSKKTEAALVEARAQGKLSLELLNDVIHDLAGIFNDPQLSTLEAPVKRRLIERVMAGLSNVSSELKTRTDFSKILIWTHLDLGTTYLMFGGEDFSNAEGLAEDEFELAYEKASAWLEKDPGSRSAFEVTSETLQKLGSHAFYTRDTDNAKIWTDKAIELSRVTLEQSSKQGSWKVVLDAASRVGIAEEELFAFINFRLRDEAAKELETKLAEVPGFDTEELHQVRYNCLDRRSLISQYQLKAMIHFRCFEIDEAVKWYRATMDAIKDAQDQNPATIGDRQRDWDIPNATRSLLICQNLPQVEKDLKHALQFEKEAGKMLYDCAAMQAYQGRHADAFETLKFAESNAPLLTGKNYYEFGCGYSRCIKALVNDRAIGEISAEENQLIAEYRTQVVASLITAREKGVFEQASMIGLLGRDHDFDPVRETDEFKAFFQEVVGKQK